MAANNKKTADEGGEKEKKENQEWCAGMNEWTMAKNDTVDLIEKGGGGREEWESVVYETQSFIWKQTNKRKRRDKQKKRAKTIKNIQVKKKKEWKKRWRL